eukprot:365047-Chlamydomonas_euryale.AAC.3
MSGFGRSVTGRPCFRQMTTGCPCRRQSTGSPDGQETRPHALTFSREGQEARPHVLKSTSGRSET